MGRTTRTRVVGLAAAVALCLAAAAPAAAQTRWGADYFPNVTLTTHEGKTVRFYEDLLKGKIVAILSGAPSWRKSHSMMTRDFPVSSWSSSRRVRRRAITASLTPSRRCSI